MGPRGAETAYRDTRRDGMRHFSAVDYGAYMAYRRLQGIVDNHVVEEGQLIQLIHSGAYAQLQIRGGLRLSLSQPGLPSSSVDGGIRNMSMASGTAALMVAAPWTSALMITSIPFPRASDTWSLGTPYQLP